MSSRASALDFDLDFPFALGFEGPPSSAVSAGDDVTAMVRPSTSIWSWVSARPGDVWVYVAYLLRRLIVE
jgi:hypothetical protein